MRYHLIIRMTLNILFLIPHDGEIERGDCMTVLMAWHDEMYDAYNDAENNLVEKKLIVRMRHGQGYTYRLTQAGKDARSQIRRLLSL